MMMMTSYQITLLLEALVSVYSTEELCAADSIIVRLVKHLRFEQQDAEALVVGALRLKEVRLRYGRQPSIYGVIQ